LEERRRLTITADLRRLVRQPHAGVIREAAAKFIPDERGSGR
jgi:hypothetical protein